MKQEFLHFKKLLEEKQNFVKDELRDNYLQGAMKVLSEHLELYKTVVDNETILHLVLKQLQSRNIHKVRMAKLKSLLLDILENSTIEMINKQNSEGDSAIHIMLKNDQFSVGVMDMLHERSADFTIKNNDGDMPIHIVAKSENLDDLKFIIGYMNKENINSKNAKTGDTALIIATQYQKINNVYFLLEENADVFETNFHGESPKDIAIRILNEERSETAKQILNIIELFEDKQKATSRIKDLVSFKKDESDY
jgi:hypothetical protein